MAKETVQVELHNQKMIDRIKEKTAGDPRLQKFIFDILKLEANGRQYKSFYKTQIQKIAEKA